MAKKLTKKELINTLVENYGYEKEDLFDDENKPFTNGKLESMIQQEEEDAKDHEARKTVTVAKQSFKDTDLITVMNGLNGSLTHRSPSTGRTWLFADFGQTNRLPYSELLHIRNVNPKVFKDCWLVVLNKQIQEDFGLIEQYDNILLPENIEEVFNKDVEELNLFIDSLPKGMKTTFIAKAKDLYHSGEIDSRKMTDFIQNKFNLSLDDNAPLTDKI